MLDPVNKVDGEAIRTAIRTFSPWGQLRCEMVRYLGGTKFHFLVDFSNFVIYDMV